jgi:hypothetical protein
VSREVPRRCLSPPLVEVSLKGVEEGATDIPTFGTIDDMKLREFGAIAVAVNVEADKGDSPIDQQQPEDEIAVVEPDLDVSDGVLQSGYRSQ